VKRRADGASPPDALKRFPAFLHYASSQIQEVSMASIADRALAVARPMAMSPDCVWVPVVGSLWVVANVGLGSVGIYTNWVIPCAFLAGLLNGTLVGVIAVATASERIQAGFTGLLGGLTLSGLRSDGSMVWKATQSIHGVIDGTLQAMGVALNEKTHDAIEQEALYMVWTMIFVVLASLVAEWARAARAEADKSGELRRPLT
jgi:hydrogenase/urease accessory protein HupE